MPLLRRRCPGDLRLAKRSYNEDAMIVSLSSELMNPGQVYCSYVPHGLVVTWNESGEPISSFGTHIRAPRRKKDGVRFDLGACSVRVSHRMVKREDDRQLRLLPLHVAMEGFLARYFGGPDIAWSEYTLQAQHRGLDPRVERSIRGHRIRGLEDALRVFEIHEGQVGVLIFVADALASAFVVPHPEDYRQLHTSLIEDFYGELFLYYGDYAKESEMATSIDGEQVEDLAGLRSALEGMREDWSAFQSQMAEGLLGRPVAPEPVYKAGPFHLTRFLTGFKPNEENHLGEMIRRADGTLEYLKTYRMSAAQCRRAYLLSQLADHGWNLDDTAKFFRQSRDELIRRLDKAGFGYILKDHVLRQARRTKR